jgi:hypothetical protein
MLMSAKTAAPRAPRAPARVLTSPDPAALSYTLQDAGRLSGLHPVTLRRRAKEGDLRLFRVGGRTLVCGASLRRLLGVEVA